MSLCSRQNLINGATAFLAGLSNFTSYESFLFMRAEDAHHNIYPLSMGLPVRMSNTEVVNMLKEVLPGLSSYHASRDESFPIIVDETKCSTFFRFLAEGEWDNGLLKQEYFILIQFTEDGKEIHEIWEMIDPNFA